MLGSNDITPKGFLVEEIFNWTSENNKNGSTKAVEILAERH